MLRCALAATAAALLACSVQAQETLRNFPATALRGELVFGEPPKLQLNGKPARLSPGARIRGTDNLMLMSAALVGRKAVVHYTLEHHGLVHEVWLLTEAEMARKPWPARAEEAAAWRFDPAAQVWSKP